MGKDAVLRSPPAAGNAKNRCSARRLDIEGIVQGVGFRPFVYRLARECSIVGEVANTSSGVTIVLEGVEEDMDSFQRELVENAPPLARITKVSAYPERGDWRRHLFHQKKPGPGEKIHPHLA